MFDKRIDTYDKANFRKRLNEFLNTAEEFKRSDINEHNINQILYKMELFRNAIYKCVKFKRSMLPDYPFPDKEDGISEYKTEYSNEILKIRINELLPPIKTPYNNKRLERTCQIIGEEYKELFKDKSVIIRVQVSVPKDNWDIDNRDLRYILNGFVYGGLISDDNIKYVSYMLEGINDRENYIKIFISEKSNIKKLSLIKPNEYF